MTLAQLVKCLDDIDKAKDRLFKLTVKRDKLADELGIKRATVGTPPAETLLLLSGEPTRFWRSWAGEITKETLTFD